MESTTVVPSQTKETFNVGASTMAVETILGKLPIPRQPEHLYKSLLVAITVAPSQIKEMFNVGGEMNTDRALFPLNSPLFLFNSHG